MVVEYTHIKSTLIGLLGSGTELYDKGVKEIISEIDSYLEQEKIMENSNQSILRTIDEYNTIFVKLVNEYRVLAKGSYAKRIDIVAEILAILSGVHAYLLEHLGKYSYCSEEIREKQPERYKIIKPLAEKLEFYKGEKYAWQSISGALKQMVAYKTELLKVKGVDKTEKA